MKVKNDIYIDINKIEDNYSKYVISLDKIDLSRDGVIHLNLIDFY